MIQRLVSLISPDKGAQTFKLFTSDELNSRVSYKPQESKQTSSHS